MGQSEHFNFRLVFPEIGTLPLPARKKGKIPLQYGMMCIGESMHSIPAMLTIISGRERYHNVLHADKQVRGQSMATHIDANARASL